MIEVQSPADLSPRHTHTHKEDKNGQEDTRSIDLNALIKFQICFDGQRLELDGDLSKIRTKMDIHIQSYTKVHKSDKSSVIFCDSL